MRPQRRRTAALATAALITTALVLSAEVRGTADSAPRAGPPALPRGASAPGRVAAVPVRDEQDQRDEARTPARYRAFCTTRIQGSRAIANCQNPYPATDRVQLHIECDRWWDIDADGAPVALEPAAHVQLTDRCWKEVRSAWVSHEPVRP